MTGSGSVSAPTYASGMQYRAFGAIKAMSYGNTRQLSVSYDSRMRPVQWDVSGFLGSEYRYDYFHEHTSRVTFARNLYDARLDRSYEYDQAARLSWTYTGAEASAHAINGQWGTQNGPYAQANFYDQFGNITQRLGWGAVYPSYTASYTNNRRNGFSYDLAGNLTSDGFQTNTYDATSQQASTSFTGYSLTQAYNGDALRVKKTENGATTYYLRSSVLGGQVVAEIAYLGGAWTWVRGYVQVGGQLLAVQQDGSVRWVHEDPVTKTKRMTDATGAAISTIVFDPWGGDVGGTWSQNASTQRRQFTTYERDGNQSDEAMMRRYNRYYSRFDQPDPYDGSYNFTNPQSLNRYSYVQNDPVNSVDPTGLLIWMPNIGNVGTVTVTADPSPIDDFFLRFLLGSGSLFGGGGGRGGEGIGGDIGGGGGGGGQDPRPQPHPTPTPQPQPNPCVDAAFNAIHRKSNRTTRAQTAISNLLAEAAKGGLTPEQAAYVLATAEHESNMGNSMVENRRFAARQNYSGGVAYRGRGYIHLTLIENYRRWGLASNPAQAGEPATAARIAVQGMRNGSFTGNSLEGSIPAGGQPDFYNARWIVIGQTRHERGVARRLVGNANDFLAALKGCGWGQ